MDGQHRQLQQHNSMAGRWVGKTWLVGWLVGWHLRAWETLYSGVFFSQLIDDDANEQFMTTFYTSCKPHLRIVT